MSFDFLSKIFQKFLTKRFAFFSSLCHSSSFSCMFQVFYKRNWATSCAGYMMLLWVLIITAIILIVIRMSSFVGYTATSGGAAAAASNTAATDTMAQAHQEL